MIWIYILILSIVIGWYIYGYSYKKEELHHIDKKENPLFILYPPIMLFMDRFHVYPGIIHEKTREAFTAIYYGKDIDQKLKIYYCKKCTFILFAFFLVTFMAFLQEITTMGKSQLLDGNQILRPGYGEEENTVVLDVVIEEEEGFLEDKISLDVAERRYDTDMILERLEEVKEYIDSMILKENESFDNIRTSIYLPKRVPNTSIIIRWELDSKNIVDHKGNLNNEDISEQGEMVELIARIKYFDVEEIYPVKLRIKPKLKTKQEVIWEKFWLKLTEYEQNSQSNIAQELPKYIEDKKIFYSEKKDKSDIKIFLAGILVSGLIYFFMDREIGERFLKRETEVLIDYPEIINKFVLLIGAGMMVKKAWEKIVIEYVSKTTEKKQKKRYAFEEMRITYHELQNGIIEEKAYESYGRRMKALPYMKFTSLLIQNQKKGTKGLLELLEYEAIDAFNERKELAKRLGEEASTKLLVPMMIMLLIVLAIIMIPAFLEL